MNPCDHFPAQIKKTDRTGKTTQKRHKITTQKNGAFFYLRRKTKNLKSEAIKTYFVFSSDYPCAVRINSEFIGKTEKDGLKVIYDNGVAPFVELCPVTADADAFALSFFADEKFLSSSHKKLAVTDLKGGFLIKNLTIPTEREFKAFAQSKINDKTVTVFNDNGVKISIENGNCSFIESLPFPSSAISLSETVIDGVPVAIISAEILRDDLTDKKILAVYSLKNSPERLFCSEVSDFSIFEGLSVNIARHDVAKHVICDELHFKDGKLVPTNRKIQSDNLFDPSSLRKEVRSYAFFEELSVGGDISAYLSDDMNEKKDKLRGYLGTFIGVFPPTDENRCDCVGLLYKKAENLYYAEYFSPVYDNDKIINVIKK